MLTGENGILKMAGKAKEKTEIASEKEQLQLAMKSMNFENETDLIKRKSIFQGILDNMFGNNEAVAYINSEGYTVHFISSNRIYNINKEIEEEKDFSILKKDSTAGILDGNGTEENPYIIMSIEDLLEWSKNSFHYRESYIMLGKTLDFKSELSYNDFTSNSYNASYSINDENVTLMDILTNENYNIGCPGINDFRGVFDGNGYEIKNYYRKGSIFGSLSNATIKNIKLTGNIKSNGNNEVGGIASYASNTEFYNICINMNIITINGDAGGILAQGRDKIKIINCCNIGNIEGAWKPGVGGMIGYVNSASEIEIINSYNLGYIYNRTDKRIGNSAGGIIGAINNDGNAIITNCYNIGEVKCVDYNYKDMSYGAIIGYANNNATINNCYYLNKDTTIVGVGYGEFDGNTVQIDSEYSYEENGSKIKIIDKLNEFVNQYNSQIVNNENSLKLWEFVNGRLDLI